MDVTPISGAGQDGGGRAVGWKATEAVEGAALSGAGAESSDGATTGVYSGADANTTERARSIDMAGLQLQGQLEARLGGAESGASDVAASSAETIDDGPEPGEGNFDNIQPGETRTYAWGTAHRTEDGTLELYADAETKSTERLRDLLGEIDAVGPDAIAKAIHRMRRRPDLTSVEAGLVRGFGALTVPFAAAFDATELAVSPIMISIAGAQFLIERGKEIRAMSPEERASWKAARRPKRATRKLEQAEDRVHVLKFGIDEAEEKGDVKGAQRLARKAEKAQARLDRLPRDLDG